MRTSNHTPDKHVTPRATALGVFISANTEVTKMHRAPFSFSHLALSALFIALALGCEGGPKNVTVEVSGKIRFKDGKPFPTGTTIVLNPAEGGSGTASGKTDADGSFTLRHSSGWAGVEVGKYTIKLIAPEGDKDFYKIVPKDVVNGDVLFAEIKEGMKPLELTVPRATGKKGE